MVIRWPTFHTRISDFTFLLQCEFSIVLFTVFSNRWKWGDTNRGGRGENREKGKREMLRRDKRERKYINCYSLTSSVTLPTFRHASSVMAMMPLWDCSTRSQMIWLLKYSMVCHAMPSLLYSSCSCFNTSSGGDKEYKYNKVTTRW